MVKLKEAASHEFWKFYGHVLEKKKG